MSFVARVFVLVAVTVCASCSTDTWHQGPVAECVHKCTAPADCLFGGDATHDLDNFECVAGLCHYLGCVSDAECSGSTPMVCRPSPYGDYRECMPPCTTVSDCVMPSPVADADNWACMDGACHWLGCTSDAECGGAAACLARADGFPPQCVPYCETALDCVAPGAKPAWNQDNYRCVQHHCEYLGCDGDVECVASIGDSICQQP